MCTQATRNLRGTSRSRWRVIGQTFVGLRLRARRVQHDLPTASPTSFLLLFLLLSLSLSLPTSSPFLSLIRLRYLLPFILRVSRSVDRSLSPFFLSYFPFVVDPRLDLLLFPSPLPVFRVRLSIALQISPNAPHCLHTLRTVNFEPFSLSLCQLFHNFLTKFLHGWCVWWTIALRSCRHQTSSIAPFCPSFDTIRPIHFISCLSILLPPIVHDSLRDPTVLRTK